MTAVAKDLFKFSRDGVTDYTVTNSDVEEIYLGDTYVPIPISRSEIESKSDMERQNITISLSLDNAKAREWFVFSQDFPITLTLYSKIDDSFKVEWKGRLTSPAPKEKTFDLVFESVFTSMRRNGLHLIYQAMCPYALYSSSCGVDKEVYADAGTVTNLTGNVVTVPEANSRPDGYFVGGIFKDSAGNLRMITGHSGTQITLLRALIPLSSYIELYGYTGLTCTLYPGCNRSMTDCNTKFSNLLNFGGFPYIPAENPFTGNSIL